MLSPEMSDSPSLFCLSPSSNSSHSSTRLTDIAARVIRQLRQDYVDKEEGDNYTDSTTSDKLCEPEEEEEEFEFRFACKEPTTSPVSADEIFLNGKIKPLYSISMSIPIVLKKAEKRMPLRMLLTEERDSSLSCTSSEADDLEGLPPDTYCVWKPKTEESRRKSTSAGSSRRWRFRNLLHRSNSDEKDTLVFCAKKENDDRDNDKNKRGALDLVGLISNVNGFSRNLRPF